MSAEYLAELAKVHEPPEMAGRPMLVRKPVSPSVVKLESVMNALGSPEKATHQQRVTAIRQLLEIADSGADKEIDRVILYGVVAITACLDGEDPHSIIGYADKAVGDDDDDGLAFRARMYLRAGERSKALDDLEKIMADNKGHALVGGAADPRKDSAPCEWSVADFEALGDDPRALAAKGLYLNSFIGYGAEDRGTVKESAIRDLYVRSAASWNSPIPHFLEVTVDGFGSQHSMAGARCIRPNNGIAEIVNACATHDEGIHQEIRELTMALVIEPMFAPALSERADKYLQLAQAFYADGKPSRRWFDLAIADYTAAIAANKGNKGNLHTLYCDWALALASIGRYQDAADGYVQGMTYAKNGVEDSPFVYEQLAGVYLKLGRFNEAADLLTKAIMDSSGGGMDAVLFGGGIRAFRTLYPEYDPVPDEILAEVIRRRYQPQFPQSWDRDFINKEGAFHGKIASSILPDLFALRGDAYMKAGRRAQALADYGRLKSNAWDGQEPYLPRQMYFKKSGTRNYELPDPWPLPPPTM